MIDLRTIRKEQGYTQQSLANESGVNRSTIAMIELHINNPSIETAKKLAKILGFNWTLFFSN